jgi:ATP-binding cassette, subfamily B, bacterial
MNLRNLAWGAGTAMGNRRSWPFYFLNIWRCFLNTRSVKFFSYYKPYRWLLLADLVCAFVVSAITLALPLCTNYITRDILQANRPDALQQIYAVGGVMLALAVVHALCNTFVDYQGHMMGALMERDMRNDLFAQYQRLSFRFYDEQQTGQLMSRLTNDLFALSELYHHGPEDLAIGLVKLVGVFCILITIDVQLTLTLFLFLPFIVAFALYFNRKMNIALRESKERIGDLHARIEDSLAGIRVVQSFANEGAEQTRFMQANDRFVQSRRDGYRNEAYFYEGMLLFTQLLTLAVIVFGGAAIVGRRLELPDLLTYLLCVGILLEPIQRFVNFARLYQEGITGFARFMDIMELTPEIEDQPDAINLAHVQGAIEFRNVSFKYYEEHDHVLKNISLAIKPGEFVALVGASGVGKTTLCALLPRFYEVNEGAVLLDGIDIRSISLGSLRRNIGVVQQEVYLFAGSVADNIRYGNGKATLEAVIAAAKQAHAHEFILALPEGYATNIGQRGVKLSGGQRQRLSLARVFLKNPPVLIFDEATSALDTASEQAVQAALLQLAAERTMIVIAHRLSTIRHADRIVVLTEDGIAEQGSHEELLARGGIYAGMLPQAVLV